MKRIPGGREVERALKESLQELRSAIKQINEQATKSIAKCSYSDAEVLIIICL